MRRLYVQIYVAFLVVGLGSLFVTGLVAAAVLGNGPLPPLEAAMAASAVANDDPTGLQARLHQVAEAHEVSLAVFDEHGEPVASVGHRLPHGKPGWFRRRGVVGVRLPLVHGGVLAAAHAVPLHRAFGGLGVLALLAAVVAVGCYPVARRITRRLEGVQHGVSRWGQGDLAARVPVEGRDEVAAVARSFNRAAAAVEQLFEAQRRVLASASHELRSPLARLRMALELARDGVADEAWISEAIGDIEELDATVGDLLQVGRMQALDAPVEPEAVDLLALLREEASRLPALVQVRGVEKTVLADRRLMRRAVRNLLDNASRYGTPPVRACVTDEGFEVVDAGPSIPPQVADRIFEPFYRPQGHHEGRDGGVGLGLFLVREVVRHHGGTVRCEPTAEGGTAFRVALP
ncbi:MAG: HAMP domain-containing histidine kinase [Myxococcales bacterium]|nr:HAMP domain-containing histidine kinase [Myxococcales bacterium]